MDIIKELLQALWHQDFQTLSDPKVAWTIYGILFAILVLENGLLPAAFLPGDSLLILTGVLIAKGSMSFPLVICILTTGASLGCWLSFAQGRWLGHSKTVQRWLLHLPPKYHQRAHQLFHRHGLSALLISRFIAFVRTVLPMLAGLSGLSSLRFQFFNWLSAFLWVLILTSLGYAMSKTPFFIRHEDDLVFILTMLPLVLLVFGLVGSLWVVWKKKFQKKEQI